MKRLITPLITGALALPAIAADPAPLPADFDYTAVTNHFIECLEGQIDGVYAPAVYKSDYTIAHDDVAAVTARIWEEWAKANNKFTVVDKKEQDLRRSLKAFPGNLVSYTIPTSLEPYIEEPNEPDKYKGPDAKMQYNIGTKGTPSGPLPMFILLHGSGPVSSEIANMKVVAAQGHDDPSIYFVPRIPNGIQNWYRWFFKSKQWVWEKVIRQAFLRSDIDNDRLYFMGVSEGAYGTQRLASFYADYLAGVGPMAGGEPLVNAPAENLRNIYFAIRTGQLDTTYGRSTLTAYADEYLNALQHNDPEGYAHNVTIVPGVGHGLGGDYRISHLLAERTRVTNPKHVRWENYAMDGRFRSGFYNLHVIERSESASADSDYERTYYEMDINGNNIDMKVSVARTVVDEWLTQYTATLPIRIHKTYTPATQGRFRIYLSDKLVELGKEVVLTVNGRELFRGVLQPNLADMVNSCAEYYDPERVYAASIDVDLASMTGSGLTSGFDEISIGVSDTDAPVSYYTLQGIRLFGSPVTPGIYIERRGSASRKVVIR